MIGRLRYYGVWHFTAYANLVTNKGVKFDLILDPR